jgi:hypothetical protein
MAKDYSYGRLGAIPAHLDNTEDYKSKYKPPPNENSQRDTSIGLGIAPRNFGGSVYQQSPAWDVNNGSTGPRGTTGGPNGPQGSIGTPGFNDRQPINGEDNKGAPVPLKGIAKSPTSISPTSPIGASSSDYSSTDQSGSGPEGTYSPNVNSNLPRPQNNEPYQMSPKSSPIPKDPKEYAAFLLSRDSISHNPYKGKD